MQGRYVKVTRLDTGETYKSMSEASEKMHISIGGLRYAMVANRPKVCHIPVRFEETATLPPKRSRKVRCVETGEEFESLTSAARAVGASLNSIWIAVNKSTRCRGMHFEYMT